MTEAQTCAVLDRLYGLAATDERRRVVAEDLDRCAVRDGTEVGRIIRPAADSWYVIIHYCRRFSVVRWIYGTETLTTDRLTTERVDEMLGAVCV